MVGERIKRFLPKQSLGILKMREMRQNVAAIAKDLNISAGYFRVTGRRGLVWASKKVGEDMPHGFKITAIDKLLTARERHHSTSLIGNGMNNQNIQPSQYGNHIPNTVPGGVAIFDKGKFIGAAAFAGGLAREQDEELVRRVIEKAGFTTDLPKQ